MKTPREQDPLEQAFEAARAQRSSALPLEFEARLMRDALAAPQTADQSETFWAGFYDGLGGWFGLTGLAAATLVGIWIGAVDLVPLSTATDSALEDEFGLLFPQDDSFYVGAL